MTEQEPIIESCGNVFADLGFSPEEATLLAMRAELLATITEQQCDWTQLTAAKNSPRNPSLMRNTKHNLKHYGQKVKPIAA